MNNKKFIRKNEITFYLLFIGLAIYSIMAYFFFNISISIE